MRLLIKLDKTRKGVLIMSINKEAIEKAYAEMQKKAATDPNFRKALMENPNKTIGEFTGQDIPADFKINILEYNPSYQMNFLVPPLNELSDEELDSLAAGAKNCLFDISPCGAHGLGPCAGNAKISLF